MSKAAVQVREDFLTLPSYLTDGFDVHPLFDELYARECYPYPLAAQRGDRHKVNAKYLAVHLENEFLEVICFPHHGGRIYSCRDKATGEDIFHRVERVSVAFCPGESGGTYSGVGMEISFPTAHSLTNARKREYHVVRNPDGSATVVMGELELRMRMRWEARITLRPGCARIEQEVRVYNRTAMYGRGRYWGNPGIPLSPRLEVSFPDEMGVEHGGEFALLTWPFYDGVDMRFPANLPGPVGLEMVNVRDGFFAYYDHDRAFGMVHWAPADEAPAKKYWTWGRSQHGRHRAEFMSDGKDFIEMQSGRVEDQEEFEMFPPFCFKRWREFWYPIRQIGPVDAAGPDVALSCRVEGNAAQIKLCATRTIPGAELVLSDGAGKPVSRRHVRLIAGKVDTHAIPLSASAREGEFRVSVLSGGQSLTTFFHRQRPTRDNGVDRILGRPPAGPRTADDLMMAYERGLDYIRKPFTKIEADLMPVLEVDPNHSAANRWKGIWLLRRGLHEEAEKHLDKALARCVHDGEAHFFKGLCRLAQGDSVEADWQFRMAYRYNWRDGSAFMLGVLALRAGDFAAAKERFEDCLDANGGNLRARLYHALTLTRMGRKQDALAEVAEARRRMSSEALTHVTAVLVSRGTLEGFLRTPEGAAVAKQLRQDVQSWLELVCDLAAVGAWQPALDLSNEIKRACRGQPALCLVDLYRGYLLDRLGRRTPARKAFALAMAGDRRHAFVFRDDEEAILQTAQEYFPGNGVVRHFRALLRGKQARFDEAYDEWREALRLGAESPEILRGLASIADKNKRDPQQAEKYLDRGLALDPDDTLIRGDLLTLVRQRGDRRKFSALTADPALCSTMLLGEIVTFRVATEDYDGAVRAIVEEAKFPNSCQRFQAHHELALASRAMRRIQTGDFIGAEHDLRDALKTHPHLGLPERMCRVQARVRYFLGLALRGQGREEEARAVWETCLTEQEIELWLCTMHWTYVMWLDRYWQGRMLLELGRKTEARAYFEGILAYSMNKFALMTDAQRRELYSLARAGTAEKPITTLITDLTYLGRE